jgi:hypothetical protein
LAYAALVLWPSTVIESVEDWQKVRKAMPTVSISFLRLQDEHNHIRTFAYKDSPEWSELGTYDDFGHHEVLELLARLGMADDAAQGLLELIIREPRIHRRQFRLTAEQFIAASQTFQQPIP